MILWIANPLCDDTACWHAALRVLRAEAAKLRPFYGVDLSGDFGPLKFRGCNGPFDLLIANFMLIRDYISIYLYIDHIQSGFVV